MKFLIVEISPLPILIPLGPKYSPQDPVFKYLSLHSSLNVRDHVSQPYRYDDTHQILAYVNDVNLIGDDIRTTERNSDINNLREKFSPGPGFEPGSPAQSAGALTN